MVLGENIISVKYKTITGEDGPVGQTLYLYYRPPAPIPTPTSQSGGPGASAVTGTPAQLAPLTIKTVDFVPYALNEKILLNAEVRGGTPPYTLKIDWGDGKVETFTVQASSVQNLSHVYTVAKATMTVIMEATDSTGQKSMVHLAAVYKSGRQLIGASSLTPPKASILDRWMTAGLWAGYASALTVLGAVWLHAKNLTPTGAAYIPAGKRNSSNRRSRA